MNELNVKDKFCDVFIAVKEASLPLFETVTETIEMRGGRIRHAFPPRIVIASIPIETIMVFSEMPEVDFLTADRIVTVPDVRVIKEFTEIISVWNNFLETAKGFPGDGGGGETLSWDAQGRLPPDPPAHLRKVIEQWQKKKDEADDS
jgi:hypothetical protein